MGNYIHGYISLFLQKSLCGPRFVLDYISVVSYYRDMENKRQYAVIDRDGFFRETTTVYSAHATVSAAIRAAKQHRMSLPGNQPNQSSAMVIRCESGFAKGEKIYGDTIRRQYPVVW